MLARLHTAPLQRPSTGCAADPAAEHFDYDVAFDIRDLINLEDAQQEAQLGPNGCISCSRACTLWPAMWQAAWHAQGAALLHGVPGG